MIKGRGQSGPGIATLGACGVLLCFLAAPAQAQERWTTAQLLGSSDSILAPARFSPFPLAHFGGNGGLTFDLGGSEEQKLQLRLAEPLLLGTALDLRHSGLAGSEISVGGSLGWLANEDLGLTVSSASTTSENSFRSLGSIHCENGVLAADSYTASNCYFIDQPGSASLTTLALGANYALSDQSSARFNVFRQQGSLGSPVRAINPAPVPGYLLPDRMGLPLLGGQPLEYLQSEVTGIDLEFQLGVSTDRAGDMRLGLQLTRILEADYEAAPAAGIRPQNWTLAGPADSARISFDWSKGAFSGGVQSYYRAPAAFLNRSGLDSMTTFDVHFTWRTPWNANLSVGASNVLNSGGEDSASGDNALADPFESVYGRIPYVRYQQDL